jgi:undecaprenyl-diphosphatase
MDALTLLKAAILGVVEGLTEFIPVSSTGHLLVAERFLGYRDPGEVFTVVIQLGAILAVCWLFRARIASLVRGVLRGDPVERRFLGLLCIATLPAAIVGYPLDKVLGSTVYLPQILPPVIAAAWAVGGLAILLIERRRNPCTVTRVDDLTWRLALIVGCCQLLAVIFPGTSRSGVTIMAALLVGISRPAATEFSFWLAIPVMFGASLLKLAKHGRELDPSRGLELAVGFAVSFVVALVVIRWLIAYVANRDFRAFAWYRLAAGVILAAILALGLLPE